MLKYLFSIVFLAATGAPAFADRPMAVADCTATGAGDASYECVIQLSQGGSPLDGAVFTVRPDMPEMPMAHNVAPIPATPTEVPGSYAVPLTLDMHGRWVLHLEISAPVRDRLVLDHDFRPEETMPAGGQGAAGHGKTMGQAAHGEHATTRGN